MSFQRCTLVVVGWVMLAACSSGRSEAMKPGPQEVTERPQEEAPPPVERPPEKPSPPPPVSRPDVGASRCGPDERECCGACIPRSEKRCPENIHCPTAAPEK
ncbi:hypothetical protein [Hyalangium sp.]|uniref:hypothetical protein n=1 Tax=Hyalangium sp. TaxID=2028555 RepID=UPI002D62FAA7|nr:hypothetical protein [Hyalangium sp.]HYI01951.1 hypothetical protein [Hyalangium sp.]